MLGCDFKDIAIRWAVLDSLAEAAHALVLALGGWLVFAGLEAGLAGVEAELQSGREFLFGGKEILGDLVLWRSESAKEKPVRVGGGGDVVVWRAVCRGHGERPFEDAQGIAGNDGVAFDYPASRGADFSCHGEA